MTEKARFLTFDIETRPTRDEQIRRRIEDEAEAKQPANNVKKEIKAEWDTQEAIAARRDEAWRKTAVDPLLAELLVVSFRADGEVYTLPCDMDEKAALGQLSAAWGELTTAETVWIGHNILGFDLPILLNRWRRHAILPPEHFPGYRNGRWHGRIFDTMKNLPCSNGLGLVSLDAACEAFAIQQMVVEWDGEKMHGGRVWDCYCADGIETVCTYCEADVQAEEALFHRLTMGGEYGLFDPRVTVRERIGEIQSSELTTDQKHLAIYQVLEQHGLVPAAA